MNYKAYVGLVDPHTKRNGCYNDVRFFIQKIVLVSDPYIRIEASMIGCGLKSIHIQKLSNLFYLLAAQAINDTGFALVIFQEPDELFLGFLLWSNFVIKVLPVKG